VTTEDDFHAALDADPHDWQTRLVFADWLQERGDPRAEGYHALGVMKLRPYSSTYSWSNERDKSWSYHGGFNLLPEDWFALTTPDMITKGVHCDFDTRRAAEDAAALAFAQLPAERRAELLAHLPEDP
jgi:uncharacterized protein (TIGR02996 family)